MDSELKRYLIDACKQWMNKDEIKALRRLNLEEGFLDKVPTSELAKWQANMIYGLEEESVNFLVSLGLESLETRIAERLLKDKNVILNRCPKCNRLARTTVAKQCRYCEERW